MLEVGVGSCQGRPEPATSPFDTDDLAQGGGEGVGFAGLTAFAAAHLQGVSRELSSGQREEPDAPAPLSANSR